jgi:hypothetical protein
LKPAFQDAPLTADFEGGISAGSFYARYVSKSLKCWRFREVNNLIAVSVFFFSYRALNHIIEQAACHGRWLRITVLKNSSLSGHGFRHREKNGPSA